MTVNPENGNTADNCNKPRNTARTSITLMPISSYLPVNLKLCCDEAAAVLVNFFPCTGDYTVKQMERPVSNVACTYSLPCFSCINFFLTWINNELRNFKLTKTIEYV